MTDSLFDIAGVSAEEIAQLDQAMSQNREALEMLNVWFTAAVEKFGGDVTQAVVLTQVTLKTSYSPSKLATMAATALQEIHRLREQINGQGSQAADRPAEETGL